MQGSCEKMEELGSLFKSTTVQQLVGGKGKLVEVPYTASVGDTLHSMLAHNILAVPVAAPPGHWIGAGGSMVVESDKATGAVRKHYIGIVSTLDILIHLAELKDNINDATALLGTPVSTIIGHCIEGLSLWAIGPHTSVFEAMDPMSKGLHRALVTLESQMDHTSGLETAEASPGYRMLTQTDLIQFLRAESQKVHPILSQSVESLGVVQSRIFGVPGDMTLVDTLRCMTQGSLSAVAIVKLTEGEQKQMQLVPAEGKRIVGTFSASDLRGCSAEAFQRWGADGVLRFLKRADVTRKFGVGGSVMGSNALFQADLIGDCFELEQVSCSLSSPLEEVISKALERKVHRVWVVEKDSILIGLVSFSDILRVVRQCIKNSC